MSGCMFIALKGTWHLTRRGIQDNRPKLQGCASSPWNKLLPCTGGDPSHPHLHPSLCASWTAMTKNPSPTPGTSQPAGGVQAQLHLGHRHLLAHRVLPHGRARKHAARAGARHGHQRLLHLHRGGLLRVGRHGECWGPAFERAMRQGAAGCAHLAREARLIQCVPDTGLGAMAKLHVLVNKSG